MVRRFSRFLKNANDKVDDAVMGAAVTATRGTGKAVGKTAFRRTDKKFFNAYTGVSESPALFLGGTAAAGTYAYGKYKADTTFETKGDENVTYSGRLPSHGYETNAPSLNASGDMVLGMHKGRK